MGRIVDGYPGLRNGDAFVDTVSDFLCVSTYLLFSKSCIHFSRYIR